MFLTCASVCIVGRDNDSLWAGWSLDEILSEGRWGTARFPTPMQTNPLTHAVSYTVGTRSFPGVKWLGHGINHPPSSSAEVKERVDIHQLPVIAFMAVCRVNFIFTFSFIPYQATESLFIFIMHTL